MAKPDVLMYIFMAKEKFEYLNLQQCGGEVVFGIYIKSLSLFSNYILKNKPTRFGSEK